MVEHMIWDSAPDYADWESDLKSEYPDLSDEELYELMYEINNNYLDDERMNLNTEIPGEIICLANLGFWNGRQSGYKKMNSKNLSSIFDIDGSDYYEVKWYVDENNECCCDAVHHDNIHYMVFRMWKPKVSETQKENFLHKIYMNEIVDWDKYTLPIGKYVAEVYGWQ